MYGMRIVPQKNDRINNRSSKNICEVGKGRHSVGLGYNSTEFFNDCLNQDGQDFRICRIEFTSAAL
jgi:hypothetical protein